MEMCIGLREFLWNLTTFTACLIRIKILGVRLEYTVREHQTDLIKLKIPLQSTV